MAAILPRLREQQFGHLGYNDTAFVTPPTGIDPWLVQRLMDDINAVAQRIFAATVNFWATEGNGAFLPAPFTSVVADGAFVQGAKTITITGLTSAMHGCTCRLSGSNIFNQILQTGASTYALLYPHDGATTATGSITVYYDAIQLTTAAKIVRPVVCENFNELDPATSEAEMRAPAYLWQRHDGNRMGSYPLGSSQRDTGTPIKYFIESSKLYTGAQQPRMRVYPMPDQPLSITWRQITKFAPVAAWTDTRESVVPLDFHESIFIPLLMAKLTKLAQFQGDVTRTLEAAGEAEAMLRSISKPQVHKDNLIQPGRF